MIRDGTAGSHRIHPPRAFNSVLAVVNIVDAVLAAVLCVFAARGYVRGLFREVFALLGLAAGFIFALSSYQQVSLWVMDSWPYSPLILQGIVFSLLFLLVFIGLHWVGLMLHMSANLLHFGGFNRVGGLLVGGAKGAGLLGVGLFFATAQAWIPPNVQPYLDQAAMVEPLHRLGASAAVLGRPLNWSGVSIPKELAAPDSPADGPQPTDDRPQLGQ